jgi:hypothetical protein
VGEVARRGHLPNARRGGRQEARGGYLQEQSSEAKEDYQELKRGWTSLGSLAEGRSVNCEEAYGLLVMSHPEHKRAGSVSSEGYLLRGPKGGFSDSLHEEQPRVVNVE